MVLFTILALAAIILTVITIALVSVGGAAFIFVFGDVIICIVLLGWLLKVLFFKKKDK